MKILIIGLGSMGKRRIRNYQSLGYNNLVGFDIKENRIKEVSELYKIPCFNNFNKIIEENTFDAWIISVPPDLHHLYIKKGIELGIPCFVEASVVDTDMVEIIKTANEKSVLIAPSCTLLFHPAIKIIKTILDKKELGLITNIIYHSGQFLPDWHTYEPVENYYVSNPLTGGAREIVPFELSWITQVIGFPNYIGAMFKKTIDIKGAEKIDDTYNLLLDYGQFILNLNVDVVSRCATRNMMINGSEKQLTWNWTDNAIKIYDPKKEEWDIINYETINAELGYNKNITEQMYIDEMDHFIGKVKGEKEYPNTLEHDHKILKVLYAAEESYTQKKFVNFQ